MELLSIGAQVRLKGVFYILMAQKVKMRQKNKKLNAKAVFKQNSLIRQEQ